MLRKGQRISVNIYLAKINKQASGHRWPEFSHIWFNRSTIASPQPICYHLHFYIASFNTWARCPQTRPHALCGFLLARLLNSELPQRSPTTMQPLSPKKTCNQLNLTPSHSNRIRSLSHLFSTCFQYLTILRHPFAISNLLYHSFFTHFLSTLFFPPHSLLRSHTIEMSCFDKMKGFFVEDNSIWPGMSPFIPCSNLQHFFYCPNFPSCSSNPSDIVAPFHTIF